MDFGQNFRKISILVKNFENLDFGQNSWNSRFIFKQSWFGPKFSNHWILSKIIVNYLNFCQNFQKILILVKIYKILDFIKIFENVDFGQNFRKILISAKILWKTWHWSKFSKNLHFSQDFWKSRFLSKISIIMSNFVKIMKIPNLVMIFDNLDFIQTFQKIMKFWPKSRILTKIKIFLKE